ncbi:MAG: ribokinase [Alphaproteobacteria bacterium]|nr:ribokinase [Alphaproteobacteria bacterium]MDD9919344.1 ribokinase [Alphaproteobacteria bacterium]
MSKVFVIGSINMDVIATIPHHPQVGETIMGDSLTYAPGGKGFNQAIAASRAGATTIMVGKVGNDGFGKTLIDFAKSENLATENIGTSQTQPTGTAFITVAKGDNIIVVIAGANDDVQPQDLSDITFQENDIVVCTLELPQATVKETFKKAKQAKAKTIFNAAPAAPCDDILALTDILIVNETEAEMLAEAITASNIPTVIQTLGEKGLKATTPQGEITLSGHQVECTDTTGAGDCFTGNLAARLAQQDTFEQALTYANAAAACAVTQLGAAPSMPTPDNVTKRLKG